MDSMIRSSGRRVTTSTSELRLKKDQRETIREIGETPITTLTGQTIKLRNVASVRETFGPVEIDRKNRTRVTKVQAGVQGRVLGGCGTGCSRKDGLS